MDRFDAEDLPAKRGHDPPAPAQGAKGKENGTGDPGPHRDLRSCREPGRKQGKGNDPELLLGIVGPVREGHECCCAPVKTDDAMVGGPVCIAEKDAGAPVHQVTPGKAERTERTKKR